MILNPHDTVVIEAAKATNSKLWLMSLKGGEYCNPSVENIAREVLLAQTVLFETYAPTLVPKSLRLYETPNCYTDCTMDSIPASEVHDFQGARGIHLREYAAKKGVVEYDDRKVDPTDDPEWCPTPCPTTLDDTGEPVKDKKNPKKGAGSSSADVKTVGSDSIRPTEQYAGSKPSSMTDDPNQRTWDFGTKWF